MQIYFINLETYTKPELYFQFGFRFYFSGVYFEVNLRLLITKVKNNIGSFCVPSLQGRAKVCDLK